MTLTSALSNALSGLRATGRGTELVSTNIANALTPGYARRVLSLGGSAIGDFGGVRVLGVQRIVDEGLASDHRLAVAAEASDGLRVGFLDRLQRALGTPDQPQSVSARLAAFEASLVTAASRPEAPERLSAAAFAARGLAESLRAAADDVQEMRGAADGMIATQVAELNTALEQVRSLNIQISAALGRGSDHATLLDQRQQVVDRIAELVPVKQVTRARGQVALYSTGGAILLDGTAARLGFERTNVVTPYLTLSEGTLSGLTLNGVALRTDSAGGPLRGGALGAQFALRDELGVAAQEKLDALARDLVARFQDPALDPSLGPGDAGLFSDGPGAFDPLDERGLASRIRLNAAVDPDAGGAPWRLRDGLLVAAPGPVGEAGLLRALSATLTDPRPAASGDFGSGAYAAPALLATYLSEVNAALAEAEQRQGYSAARRSELAERQLAAGVDSDAEIQRLVLLEQSYAANARVIQTVDELLDTLTRI